MIETAKKTCVIFSAERLKQKKPTDIFLYHAITELIESPPQHFSDVTNAGVKPTRIFFLYNGDPGAKRAIINGISEAIGSTSGYVSMNLLPQHGLSASESATKMGYNVYLSLI